MQEHKREAPTLKEKLLRSKASSLTA